MMRRTLTSLIALTGLVMPLWADADVAEEMKKDVVLRAMVDELERNAEKLHIEDLERPYFIEYALVDAAGGSVSAELGAVTGRSDNRQRSLRAEVRVGSYELDNTNFAGGGFGGFFGGGFSATPIPIEDDYEAIRQSIWWATDREYKDVVESLEQKKAFMESKMIEDKPVDFSREEPAVFFEEKVPPEIDVNQLEMMALEISKVFRDYPDVQQSSVNVSQAGGNKYLINSEGTRIRTEGSYFTLSVEATVQAEDGMKLTDSFEVAVPDRKDVPPLSKLIERAKKMADELLVLSKAPILESYTGPVLFDPEPSVELFAGRFAGYFTGGQRPVGSRTDPDDFANKLQQRVLPRFVDVVDDPTIKTLQGQPVMGHYQFDDQGVPAQRVELVEGGKLLALLMSRNPSKEFLKSNGHGRGVYSPRASIGCLVLSSESGLDEKGLREELLEACADEGLEYGLRIASMGTVGGGDGGFSFRGRRFGGGGGGGRPLLMYKVYPDGREELVRGAQIANIDLKNFKQMLAVGDTLHVENSAGMGGGRTVAAPALLFEELDLAKIDEDFDKPPILPAPLKRTP